MLRPSLPIRDTLRRFLPWLALITLLAALAYTPWHASVLAPLRQTQLQRLALAGRTLETTLDALARDLDLLARRNHFDDEVGPQQNLEDLFFALLALNPDYRRIAWIDSSGAVRSYVDGSRTASTTPPLAALVPAVDAAFFDSMMHQPAGTLFLTRQKLDGIEDAARTRRLQLATPVFDSRGRAQGMILLVVEADRLSAALPPDNDGGQTRLIDHDGNDWLAGAGQDQPAPLLDERTAQRWHALNSSASTQFSDTTGLWSFQRIHTERWRTATAALDWTLVSQLPPAVLQAQEQRAWWPLAGFAVLTLLPGLVAAFGFACLRQRQDQQPLPQPPSDGPATCDDELNALREQLDTTQEQLLQADKLASLGVMVAGVAHDLNTPIGAALVTLSALDQQAIELTTRVRNGLRFSDLEHFFAHNEEGRAILRDNLQRAAALIHSFKQIAADRATSERREFVLDELVADMLRTLSPRLKRLPQRVETAIEPGLRFDSYPGPLGQVLQNLIDNALTHAFREVTGGGTVRIRAAAEDTERVRIDVEDDGCGIAEDILPQVFEPFFTTRRGQGGTGLGLHLVRDFVSGLLGGEVQVSCPASGGTRFTLILPRVAAAPEDAGTEPTAVAQ